MAGPTTHRRALGYRAAAAPPDSGAYVSPYPTNGLLAYYDTNFGRARAVTEVNGQVVAFRQQVAGSPIPDLTGGAYWQTDEHGVPCLGFASQGLNTAFGYALAMPYTLVVVVKFDPDDPSQQNNGGLVFASGVSTPGGSTRGLLLYTGYGGTNQRLKVNAGGDYLEPFNLSTRGGHAAYGVSASPDNTAVVLCEAVAAGANGAGTASLASLSLGDSRLTLNAVLLYSRALTQNELYTLLDQLRNQFNY